LGIDIDIEVRTPREMARILHQAEKEGAFVRPVLSWMQRIGIWLGWVFRLGWACDMVESRIKKKVKKLEESLVDEDNYNAAKEIEKFS